MFQNLTDRFQTVFKQLRGQGRLTENNIKDVLKEVRTALLEADVALEVVQHFISRVKKRALGSEVGKSLNPGQAMIKLVKRELVLLLGENHSDLNLKAQPPVVILMAGLQGAGKTTTAAKLARFLKENQNKKVLLVSTDIYRPAAILQLKTLAQELEIECFDTDPGQSVKWIAESAMARARRELFDVLIVDTAGRLHVDESMMAEIKSLAETLNPVETLFVVDSMTGQDAVNTAKVFGEALPLTGVILTKIDGDARGGAALSVLQVTGRPIKFLGTGEKTGALEAFHPDRMASRILGMGDVLSLIEQVEQKADKAASARMAEKFKKGKAFDYEDFLQQLNQLEKLGGMANLLGKLPMMGQVSEVAKQKMNDKSVTHMKAIIQSMTLRERRRPEIINTSRKQRIADGSGRPMTEVNKLLKQFVLMQKTLKQMKNSPGKFSQLMG